MSYGGVNGGRFCSTYPLRGMPIQIEPDFDAPMNDLWAALGE